MTAISSKDLRIEVCMINTELSLYPWPSHQVLASHKIKSSPIRDEARSPQSSPALDLLRSLFQPFLEVSISSQVKHKSYHLFFTDPNIKESTKTKSPAFTMAGRIASKAPGNPSPNAYNTTGITVRGKQLNLAKSWDFEIRKAKSSSSLAPHAHKGTQQVLDSRSRSLRSFGLCNSEFLFWLLCIFRKARRRQRKERQVIRLVCGPTEAGRKVRLQMRTAWRLTSWGDKSSLFRLFNVPHF